MSQLVLLESCRIVRIEGEGVRMEGHDRVLHACCQTCGVSVYQIDLQQGRQVRILLHWQGCYPTCTVPCMEALFDRSEHLY